MSDNRALASPPRSRNQRPKRSRLRAGALVALIAMMIASASCSQSTPGAFPTPPTACVFNDDCPAGTCSNGSCSLGSAQPDGGERQRPDLAPIEKPPLPDSPPGTCTPGETQPCYAGPEGTQDVGQCQSGQFTCKDDGTWGSCEGVVSPSTEVCDGEDNDCDGKTDEGFPNLGQPCSKGDGACAATGVMSCSKDKKDVLCSATPSQPQTETCNGIDDDCDGDIDEDFADKGKPCTNGQGACKTDGTTICNAAQDGVICSAKERLPSDEVCDGKDNDCDGNVDNQKGTSTPLSRACYTGPAGTKGVGTCKDGTQTCTSGAWQDCQGETKPASKEDCNDNLDNDCNGQINDGCVCKTGESRPCSLNQGECTAATQTCVNNQWEACPGITPTTELCDGKDNDCDGKTDEDFNVDQPCTAGQGECQKQGKYECKDASSTQCSVTADTGSKEVCDGKDNDCNGSVDDGLDGTKCTTSLKGKCADGTFSCVSGKGTCIPIQKPTTEICNDQDDDCDGQTDEVCGARYDHIVVDANGAIAKRGNADINRGFASAQRTGNGEYLLTHKSRSCNDAPLFLLARDKFMRGISYDCDRNNSKLYRVNTSQAIKSTPSSSTNPRGDVGFHAVLPAPGDDWALVYPSSQCERWTGGNCTIAKKSGSTITKVEYRSTGSYRVYSSLCAESWRPLFFTLQAGSVSYYISGHKSNGGDYCEVSIYNNSGGRANRTFAIWLPDRDKAAWASIEFDKNGTTIHKSQTPNSTASLWSSKHINTTSDNVNCPNSGSCTRLEATYSAWSNPGAALVTFRRTYFGTASALFDTNGKLNISLFDDKNGRLAQTYTGRATILLVR